MHYINTLVACVCVCVATGGWEHLLILPWLGYKYPATAADRLLSTRRRRRLRCATHVPSTVVSATATAPRLEEQAVDNVYCQSLFVVDQVHPGCCLLTGYFYIEIDGWRGRQD